MPESVREAMTFHLADSVDDVLASALAPSGAVDGLPEGGVTDDGVLVAA